MSFSVRNGGRSAKTAVIFGGSGFVGCHVVKRLAAAGYTVKVVSRVPERASFLKTCGSVGQVVPFYCDYSAPAHIQEAVKGADVVINCVAVLFEKKKNRFQRLHAELPRHIASACAREGVERFVHISALSVSHSTSKYAASKKAGEEAVRAVFPQATILRPSIIFGPEDNFFNMFASMARLLPALPLIGGGRTKFQPVYVGDVADAVMATLSLPPVGEGNPCGRTYELGGPEVVTFRDIFNILFRYTGRKRLLVNLPYGLAKIQAAFLSVMPQPLLTPDQVESLKTDSVVSSGALTLQTLGVVPTGMALILPAYLETYRAGGRFADKKTA